MAEMWGLAGGFRNFAQDQMQLEKLALDKQEAQNLERHREASRSATLLQLSQSERELLLKEDEANEQREMRAALATPGEGEDLATPAGQIRAYQRKANTLLSKGYVEEAAKLSNTAAQILQRLESAGAASALEAQRAYELAEKKTRRVQELLTGVNSQADLDRARLVMMNDENLRDEATHPVLQNFDRATLNQMLAGSPALLEKMKLDRARADDLSKRQLRDARIAYLDFRKGIDERRTRDAENRTAAREKAGAANAGGRAPATRAVRGNERDEVERVLKAGNLLVDDRAAKDLQISSLSEDALTLMQNNPGIRSFSEAVEHAIASAKQRGELSVEKGTFNDSPKFARQAGSVSRPAAIPPNGAFREGYHYRNSKGDVVRFEGGKFIPVYAAGSRTPVAPSAPSSNNPYDFDDEEGEE